MYELLLFTTKDTNYTKRMRVGFRVVRGFRG